MAARDTLQMRLEPLIDRMAETLRPAPPPWPLWMKFALWLALEFLVIASVTLVTGISYADINLTSPGTRLAALALIVAGAGMGALTLRSAIPDRKPSRRELILISVLMTAGLGAALSGSPAVSAREGASGITGALAIALYLVSLAILPWCGLFAAVRRGTCLRPRLTGALMGGATFGPALAMVSIVAAPATRTDVIAGQFLPATLAVLLSAIVVDALLRKSIRWRDKRELYAANRWPPVAAHEPRDRWPLVPRIPSGLAVPIGALATVLIAVVLYRVRPPTVAVADFDRAIALYNASGRGFQSNIPSDSLDAVANAYLDHGVPPYVWNFGVAGYELIGGRVDGSAQDSPVALTLYRRTNGATLICVVARTRHLHPPPEPYAEKHHYRFYEYRGYRLAVGYYGLYAVVMVTRAPMREFVAAVAAAVPTK